jgi:hypothetical protein
MASGVLLLGMRQAPQRELREAAKHWFLAISAAPLGWLLLEWALAGGPVSLFIVGKTLVMAAFVEFLRATSMLQHPANSARVLHVSTVVVLLATSCWLLVWPQIPIRSSLLSLLCAGFALWAGHRVWTPHNRRTSLSSLLVAGGLSVAAAALLLRAAHYASPGWSLQWLPRLPAGLLLGLLLVALIVATVGFALLLSAAHLRRVAELDGVLSRPQPALPLRPIPLQRLDHS